MPLEPGLIAYAAFANFAAAHRKHRPVSALGPTVSPAVARWIGIVLLLLSITVAMMRFGAAQGVVAWAGQLCVAGVLLVLLLSWRPKTALMLAAPAMLAALAVAIF